MAGKKNSKQTDLRKVPKDKRGKPTTGQSADEQPLPYEVLNDDEREIVRMLNGRNGDGVRHVRSIEFLAEGIDGSNPRLQVRNALRRTVACGWVDHVSRGQYQISGKGRKRLTRL
jgi:hypothetical protein